MMKVLRGSRMRPSRRSLVTAAVVTGLALTGVVAAPGQAWAINAVGCNGRTDLVKIVYPGSASCFANSGSVDVYYPRVTELYSGNNRVCFYFLPSQSQSPVCLGRGGSATVPSWTVKAIWIK